MAMNAATLKTSILAALTSAGFNVTGYTGPPNYLDEFIEAIATGVINHIVANGVTTTVVSSGSSAGTYPGTIT